MALKSGKTVETKIPSGEEALKSKSATKTEEQPKGFEELLRTAVPEKEGKVLLAGGSGPKVSLQGPVVLPAYVRLHGRAYEDNKREEYKQAKKIFKAGEIAAVVGVSTYGKQANIVLGQIKFFTWHYLANAQKEFPPVTALSVADLVITSDRKLVLQERSGSVTGAERMLSTPSGYLGSEFLKKSGSILPKAALKYAIKDLGAKLQRKDSPEFVALIADTSVSKNNTQALFELEVRNNSAEIMAMLRTAEDAAKTARLEFVDIDQLPLLRYYVDNFHRMTPHLKLGLLAFGYLNFGELWVSATVTELERKQLKSKRLD